MGKYKYLLFDLDDTLLDFKKAEKCGVTEAFKKLGIASSDRTVELYSAINLSCWKQYERGEISKEDIYKNRVIMLSEQLGVAIDVEEFSNKYFLSLSMQGHTLPFAFTLLNTLSQKGYKLAAATNGARSVQTGRLVASGIAGFFKSGIFISEQIGLKKPDAEFFDYILNTLGVQNKNEVLVIGDSLSSDIRGAVNARLDSCFVNLKGEALPDNCKPTYVADCLEDVISVCGL